MSKYTPHHSPGLTLIELMLYCALVGMFMTSAILVAWNIIYARQKSQVTMAVNQNLRLASKRIEYEIKNAAAINVVNPTSICLSSADSTHNPTHIYLSNGRLFIGWGGGVANCASTTTNAPLTSNQVSISQLMFTNLSNMFTTNIRYVITIETTGNKPEWQASQQYSGAVELRSH